MSEVSVILNIMRGYDGEKVVLRRRWGKESQTKTRKRGEIFLFLSSGSTTTDS